MSIEIKHKAKSTHKECFGKWIYGYYAKAQDQPLIIESLAVPYMRTKDKSGFFNPIACPVDENTVCLYSGLKDKNKTDIYTGDILRLVLPDGSIRHFIVEFKTVKRTLCTFDEFTYKTSNVNINGIVFSWNGFNLYPNDWEHPDNEKMEIIGNIFDNPELIIDKNEE